MTRIARRRAARSRMSGTAASRWPRRARHTRMRAVGGHELARRCRAYSYRPRIATTSRTSCAACRPAMPVTVLGLGSNVLVRDGGIRGAVVLLHNPGAALAVADGVIYADAGVASPKLARFAAMHGCADAEFLAGIPGTRRRRAGDERRLLRRRDVDPRRARRDAGARWQVRRSARPRDYSIGYRSVAHRDGRALAEPVHGGVVSLSARRRRDGRARGSRRCSRGASRRSRSRCRTPAACSAIRRAIMRRG